MENFNVNKNNIIFMSFVRERKNACIFLVGI